MWNENRSLALSKLSVNVFSALLLVGLISTPTLVRWLHTTSYYSVFVPNWCFYLTIYSGGAVAGLLLFDLYCLLHNLGVGKIFVAENEAKLRRISWYCIVGAAIAFASGFYYMPWFFIALAAGFVGLIVRVVKNVVAEAILLKDENDLMI